MKLRSLRKISVRGRRVLVRAGFNVPLTARGTIVDDWRIRTALPTLRWLIRQRARVVIVSHLGRPAGQRVARLSLQPVAQRLSKLLGRPVEFSRTCIGPSAQRTVARLKPGHVALLENLRFEPGEEGNSSVFARQLARLGDVYVNDAFENVHRRHASMVRVPRLLPSAAGLLLASEVETLTRVLQRPARPFLTIIGGAKISTKIGLVRSLLPRVDNLLLGGALANTVLRAQGIQVGRSLIEPSMLRRLRTLKLTDRRLHVPIDVIVTGSRSARAKTSRRPVGGVRPQDIILDIGPDTRELYARIIARAKTIVWNGPLGYCELPAFSLGTRSVARAIARSDAESILGGGETREALKSTGLLSKFSFVSTGGGAMLELLEGRQLPGLIPLSVSAYGHH